MTEIPKMMMSLDIPTLIGLAILEITVPFLDLSLLWLVEPSAGVQRNNLQLHFQVWKASIWPWHTQLKRLFGFKGFYMISTSHFLITLHSSSTTRELLLSHQTWLSTCEQSTLVCNTILSTNGLKTMTSLLSMFLWTTKSQTFLWKHSCTTNIPCLVPLWDYMTSISIEWVCLKSIDIWVDVAIVTSCIIYVDEQTSPFLDCLVLNMTCYSDSCSYKSENILLLPFSPQFLT